MSQMEGMWSDVQMAHLLACISFLARPYFALQSETILGLI